MTTQAIQVMAKAAAVGSGTLVAPYAARKSMLEEKTRGRCTAHVRALAPRGAKDVSKYPRRRDLPAGEKHNKIQETLMANFMDNFSESHGQDGEYHRKMRTVEHFGEFLRRESYGVYMNVKETGEDAVLVAMVDCSMPKLAPPSSLVEYMLAMVRKNVCETQPTEREKAESIGREREREIPSAVRSTLLSSRRRCAQ